MRMHIHAHIHVLAWLITLSFGALNNSPRHPHVCGFPVVSCIILRFPGTLRPSITDVVTRLTFLQQRNVSQMSLAVNWTNPNYLANQAMLDVLQLPLMYACGVSLRCGACCADAMCAVPCHAVG